MTALIAVLQLIVLCAGAASSVVRDVAAGRNIVVQTGTVGQIVHRLSNGERADVVILSAPALKKLGATHAVIRGTQVALGRSPMAVGVRAGAPVPDVSSVEAFKQTLLRARRIAATDPKAGASSGIYFAKLLRRLGIANEIEPKERLTPGGRSCELVARRLADVCVQNITEVIPVKGVVVAGKLPPEIQNEITYSAVVLSRTNSPRTARAFVDDLSSRRSVHLWQRAGFEAPR